jgi:hypothetical protein
VKSSDPQCTGFVGVIIQRETPKSRFDANWAVRGVKFGAADRTKSLKATEMIVERMQRNFLLSDDQRAQARRLDEAWSKASGMNFWIALEGVVHLEAQLRSGEIENRLARCLIEYPACRNAPPTWVLLIRSQDMVRGDCLVSATLGTTRSLLADSSRLSLSFFVRRQQLQQ